MVASREMQDGTDERRPWLFATSGLTLRELRAHLDYFEILMRNTEIEVGAPLFWALQFAHEHLRDEVRRRGEAWRWQPSDAIDIPF